MPQKTVTPYDDSTRSKSEQVESMFDNIASSYDRMNTLMSAGLHRRWRDNAIKDALYQLRLNGIQTAGMDVLDVATGTGDLVFSLHRRLPEARISGVDISEGMLSVARQRLAGVSRSARNLLSFYKTDCEALPFFDGSFDLVTVAYGVRNFENREAGLREMARVLRPGGLVCIIELSVPEHPLSRRLYDIYSGRVIPAVGRLVSGDDSAYRYLPESIAAAPQRDDLTRIMASAGLCKCRWRSMTFGVVTIYIGEKEK